MPISKRELQRKLDYLERKYDDLHDRIDKFFGHDFFDIWVNKVDHMDGIWDKFLKFLEIEYRVENVEEFRKVKK
jgi:hypothetical protein